MSKLLSKLYTSKFNGAKRSTLSGYRNLNLKPSTRNLTIFIISFAIIGSIILIVSHAASPTASIEPEQSSVKCPASSGADSTASGGAYVQFKSASCTTGTCTSSGSTCILADFNNTDIAKPFRYYNQYTDYIQSPNTNGADQARINALGTKYERGFGGPGLIDQAGFQQYDFNANIGAGFGNRYGDSILANLKSNGISPVLTGGWPDGWNLNTTNCMPNDMNKFITSLKDWYVHDKQNDPNIQYVESVNEPDGTGNHCTGSGQSAYLNDDQVFQYYDATQKAAKQANTALGLPKPGDPALKVGGPTLSAADIPMIDAFLSRVKNSGDELDFLSWHAYYFHDFSNPNDPNYLPFESAPLQLATTDTAVRNVMNKYGFGNIATLITEWNSRDLSGTPNGAQAANHAAFEAASLYQYMETNITQPYQFAQVDFNPTRSLLVPPGVNGSGGNVYPNYNVYKMYTMMQPSRVVLTTNPGFDSNGLGVGAIATKAVDGSSATILTWNYLASNSQTKPLHIQLNNLPAVFNGKSIIVQRYVIDNTHSNWANNGDNNLDQLSSLTLSAGGSTSISGENLAPNGIELLVLKPGS